MNLLRSINKLSITSTVKAFFSRWKIEGKDLNTSVDVLFPIGCVGISSSAKTWISKFQADNYAFLVSNASAVIDKFQLQDGDYFYGKDENYLLVQDDNMTIKTKVLNLLVDNINITVSNNITVNGIVLTFNDNKMLINGKQIAVVGGDISTITNKITTSGQ